MRRFFNAMILAAVLSPGFSCLAIGGERLVDYVEPRIGTAHCRYFHFAPGSLPFGMAKPGPSTNGHLGNRSGWEATGYDYRDSSIEGFPCAHEFQVGGITLMATRGGDIPVTIPGRPDGKRALYRTRKRRDRKDRTGAPPGGPQSRRRPERRPLLFQPAAGL